LSSLLYYFRAPFLCIHHQLTIKFTRLIRFTLYPFEKMLGSWDPEFVHMHVFMGMHETINSNREKLKL